MKTFDPATVRRVLFAGDVHVNLDHMKWVYDRAVSLDVDLIIPVGDFGFWPGWAPGDDFMRWISETGYASTGIPTWSIDGNHDNHNFLDSLPRRADQLADVLPGLRYIPRSARFKLRGTTFLGLGGAWSYNWQNMKPGVDWFPQETITPEQIDACGDDQVDVLVTHDAPIGRELSYPKASERSLEQRTLISRLIDRTRPSLVVCGHHHQRVTYYAGTIHRARVEVLDRDGTGGLSISVFETKDANGH